MKHILLVFVLSAIQGFGQRTEFKVHSNGLIYDPQTMSRLEKIVDSLNLKFRTCDMAHPYHSFEQGLATIIQIPSKAVLKYIESNPSLPDLLKMYPKVSKAKHDLWVTKTRYKNYEGHGVIEYAELPHGWGQETSIELKDRKANDKNTGWIVDKENSIAFYLHQLTKQKLPVEYGRLIQYVDCMVDTTAEIYFPQAKGSVYQRVNQNSKASQFITWAEKFPERPERPDYDQLQKTTLNIDSVYTSYYKKEEVWDSLRMLDLDKRLSKSPYWKDLLAQAIEEGIIQGNSDPRLEFYAARYQSKSDALKLMRSRKVIGNCSMDQSPRYHAMNICRLAAETAQWDIFLRSHLDIMNDRFDRQSDGSYAWAARKTYLMELEKLDINAIDLLLGTTLRVSDVSENHYWGSIGRVGRALADALDKPALESRLVAMIKDDNLDPFNRLLMAYLFNNYAHNLEETNKTDSLKKLEDAVKSFPPLLAEVWKKSDEK